MRHALVLLFMLISTTAFAQKWRWVEGSKCPNCVCRVTLDGQCSTGVVISVDKSQKIGSGHTGYLLTAAHAVSADKGRRAVCVAYQNGKSAKRCKVVSVDDDNDVALVWAWMPDGITPATVGDPVQPGDPVCFAGLGGGATLQSIRYFCATAADPTNPEKIFAPCSLLPGDSGGPAFNQLGQVVGIISGGWLWYECFGKEASESKKAEVDIATWPARACNAKAVRKILGKEHSQTATLVTAE